MSGNSESYLDAVYRMYLTGYAIDSTPRKVELNFQDVELSELTAFAIGMMEWKNSQYPKPCVDLIEEINELLAKNPTVK